MDYIDIHSRTLLSGNYITTSPIDRHLHSFYPPIPCVHLISPPHLTNVNYSYNIMYAILNLQALTIPNVYAVVYALPTTSLVLHITIKTVAPLSLYKQVDCAVPSSLVHNRLCTLIRLLSLDFSQNALQEWVQPSTLIRSSLLGQVDVSITLSFRS